MENTLTKFHLFPKLLPEVRIGIWHEAAKLDDKPRVFELGLSDDIESTVGTPTIGNVKIARWSCPQHPALMSVCHESRAEALKKYRALKFCNLTIFVDFELDWIFLPEWSKYDGLNADKQWWVWKDALVNGGLWAMIRNLAIPAGVWAQLSWTEDLVNGTTVTRWATELEGLSSLKKVVMAFEVWAQYEEDKLKKFATKGDIWFDSFEKFYYSGGLAGQWVEHAKSQLKEIEELNLSWTLPEVTFSSVTRGGREPIIHEVMRPIWDRAAAGHAHVAREEIEAPQEVVEDDSI